MKHDYITRVFTNLKILKINGIYFSGKKSEGEYKRWWENGQLAIHCFHENGLLNGEFKEWYTNGQLFKHCFYKNNELHGDYRLWDHAGNFLSHKKFDRHEEIKDYPL